MPPLSPMSPQQRVAEWGQSGWATTLTEELQSYTTHFGLPCPFAVLCHEWRVQYVLHGTILHDSRFVWRKFSDQQNVFGSSFLAAAASSTSLAPQVTRDGGCRDCLTAK